MIDWTNSSAPEYYYAEMESNISLNSFKSITDQDKSYFYDSSIETPIKHTWVFIIDLSGSSLTADQEVQLELVSGEQTFTGQSISLTAKESRSFTLGTNAENGAATVGERIVFNYGSSGLSGAYCAWQQ